MKNIPKKLQDILVGLTERQKVLICYVYENGAVSGNPVDLEKQIFKIPDNQLFDERIPICEEIIDLVNKGLIRCVRDSYSRPIIELTIDI